MRALLSIILIALSTLPAAATGGFNCIADDPPVAYELRAGITRGLGSPAFNFNGTLTIAEGVPEGFRSTTFEASDLTMYWLDEMEFRILAHHEMGSPSGFVEVKVMTQVSEEAIYGGQFEITLYDNAVGGDGTKITGVTTCWFE